MSRAPEDSLARKKIFTGVRALRVRGTRDAHCIYIPSVDSSLLSSCNVLPTGQPPQ